MARRDQPGEGHDAPVADTDFGAGSPARPAPRQGGRRVEAKNSGSGQKTEPVDVMPESWTAGTSPAETHLVEGHGDPTSSVHHEPLTDAEFEPIEVESDDVEARRNEAHPNQQGLY